MGRLQRRIVSGASFAGVLLLLLVSGVRTWAEDRTPSDKYVKVFAGKTLTDGRGFVGQLEIGAPLPVVRPLLGWGHEKGYPWSFWYFYEKGPWTLTIIARPDYERCNFLYHVEALVLEGAQAPPTKRGIRIGDSLAKVKKVYGRDTSELTQQIDSRGVTKTTWLNPNTPRPDKGKRRAFDQSVRSGRYYPQHGMLFTFADGKVNRIIALFEYDETALWLRDKPDPPQAWIAVVKPGVKKPTWEHPEAKGHKGLLHLPPPPAVEPAQVAGLRVAVPKGWARTGTTWTSPHGAERVRVEALPLGAVDDDPEDAFDELEDDVEHVLTVRAQRAVPRAVCERLGVDTARTFHYQQAKAGIDGWPARTWELLLAKGRKRWRVSVTRTTWQRNPSPDGIELSRRVFTSVRVAP